LRRLRMTSTKDQKLIEQMMQIGVKDKRSKRQRKMEKKLKKRKYG